MTYTKEDVQNWLSHPVTQDFVRVLMEFQEEIKESWAQGHIQDWEQNRFEQGRFTGVGNALDTIETIKAQFEDQEVE